MTFGTARGWRRARTVLIHGNQSIKAVSAINRPEYYVLPVKHPANCQCSEHQSKASCVPHSVQPVEAFERALRQVAQG
jgi:hypothetical protein